MTGLLKRRVFLGNRNHIPLRNPWDYHSNDMKKPTIWLSLKYLIYFFYIRKTIQLSMTRIYEEKRDISKHRKLKNKTNTTFFWYNNKKKENPEKPKFLRVMPMGNMIFSWGSKSSNGPRHHECNKCILLI